MGTYLSPAMHLPHTVDGWVLGITMALVATLMATGFRARYGSQPQLRPLVSALRLPARPRHLVPALKGALQS
jgi:hypothetical protein